MNMVVKCFFKRSMNCIVYEKRRNITKDADIILEPDMNQPKPAWCVSCLVWQQLKELKNIGDRLERLLLQEQVSRSEDKESS